MLQAPKWISVKAGKVDRRFVESLSQWLDRDPIISVGDDVPVLWVPVLHLGFVVISAVREDDPIRAAWEGLDRVPATWEKFVVFYGLCRANSEDVERAQPLFVQELIDGGIHFVQFRKMQQAAEFVAHIINRRRGRRV